MPNYYKERHEYTVVIELSHHITEVIGDRALAVDVDIVPDNQSESHIEFFPGEPSLEYNNIWMDWSKAEKFCVSKGGHLASVASPSHWQKLQRPTREIGLGLIGANGRWSIGSLVREMAHLVRTVLILR